MEWLALHALAQSTARLLLTHEQDQEALRHDWEVYTSFAQLGMEERAKGRWYAIGDTLRMLLD